MSGRTVRGASRAAAGAVRSIWAKLAAKECRQQPRFMIEVLEGRRLMSVTGLSVDQGDYVAPTMNGSDPGDPGSMVERVSGINASFTFTTDHNAVDGGMAYALINWGDFVGPIAPQTVFAGNTYSLQHTYAEEGDHTLDVTVYDTDTPSQGGTTSGWQGTSQSSAMDLQVSDAPLEDNGGGFEFDPNYAYSGIVGGFKDDGGVVDMNEYSTPMIDWGDGTVSAGTLEQAGGDWVNIMGSHTYAYQTTDTGEIARPLWMYNEQADYTIQTHIDDAGGSSIDLMWTSHAHLNNWIGVKDATATSPNNLNDPKGLAPTVAPLVHISIAATPAMTYSLIATEYDRADSPAAITAPPFTVTPRLMVGAIAGLAVVVGPGANTETITLSWNGATVGTRVALDVIDPGSGAMSAHITLIFDP